MTKVVGEGNFYSSHFHISEVGVFIWSIIFIPNQMITVCSHNCKSNKQSEESQQPELQLITKYQK